MPRRSNRSVSPALEHAGVSELVLLPALPEDIGLRVLVPTDQCERSALELRGEPMELDCTLTVAGPLEGEEADDDHLVAEVGELDLVAIHVDSAEIRGVFPDHEVAQTPQR